MVVGLISVGMVGFVIDVVVVVVGVTVVGPGSVAAWVGGEGVRGLKVKRL